MERKEVQITVNEGKQLEVIKLYPRYRVEMIEIDPALIKYNKLKGLKSIEYHSSTASKRVSKTTYIFSELGREVAFRFEDLPRMIHYISDEDGRKKERDIIIVYNDNNDIIFASSHFTVGDEIYLIFDKDDRLKLCNKTDLERDCIDSKIYEYKPTGIKVQKDKKEIIVKRVDTDPVIVVDNDAFTVSEAIKDEEYMFNNLIDTRAVTKCGKAVTKISMYSENGRTKSPIRKNDFILYKGEEPIAKIMIYPGQELKITIDSLDRVTNVQDIKLNKGYSIEYTIYA